MEINPLFAIIAAFLAPFGIYIIGRAFGLGFAMSMQQVRSHQKKETKNGAGQ